jgi:hypothetical protein
MPDNPRSRASRRHEVSLVPLQAEHVVRTIVDDSFDN